MAPFAPQESTHDVNKALFGACGVEEGYVGNQLAEVGIIRFGAHILLDVIFKFSIQITFSVSSIG